MKFRLYSSINLSMVMMDLFDQPFSLLFKSKKMAIKTKQILKLMIHHTEWKQ